MTWLDTIGSVLTTGTRGFAYDIGHRHTALLEWTICYAVTKRATRCERFAGALCTWAAYDIYRRWNGPTQVIPGHVQRQNVLGQFPETPTQSATECSALLQAHPARSDAEERLVDRGEPQGAFLPGLQAFQQNGSGWYTTTITVNHGDQQGAVTLHDLLGPAGHFDLEHGNLRDFLVHMQELQGLAGAHRGNLALDRIAQAGPQDFTEVSSRCLGDGSSASPLQVDVTFHECLFK